MGELHNTDRNWVAKKNKEISGTNAADPFLRHIIQACMVADDDQLEMMLAVLTELQMKYPLKPTVINEQL
jgi:hypothetical protein